MAIWSNKSPNYEIIKCPKCMNAENQRKLNHVMNRCEICNYYYDTRKNSKFNKDKEKLANEKTEIPGVLVIGLAIGVFIMAIPFLTIFGMIWVAIMVLMIFSKNGKL